MFKTKCDKTCKSSLYPHGVSSEDNKYLKWYGDEVVKNRCTTHGGLKRVCASLLECRFTVQCIPANIMRGFIGNEKAN